MSFLDPPWKPLTHDVLTFGSHWCGPKTFEHGVKTLVAHYPKERPDGDGFEVEVYATLLPATFYTIHVLPGTNSMGQYRPGAILTTGTGMALLVHQMATAISEGMLGVQTT